MSQLKAVFISVTECKFVTMYFLLNVKGKIQEYFHEVPNDLYSTQNTIEKILINNYSTYLGWGEDTSESSLSPYRFPKKLCEKTHTHKKKETLKK